MNSTLFFILFVLGTLTMLTSALAPLPSDSDSVPIVNLADKPSSSAFSSKILERNERFLGGFGFSKSFAVAGGGGQFKNAYGANKHKRAEKIVISLLVYILEATIMCFLFCCFLEENNYEDYDNYDEEEDDDEYI